MWRPRFGRSLLAGGLCGVGGLLLWLPGAVWAAPSWRAPDTCPSQQVFLERVQAMGGSDALELSFEVQARGGGYRMKVRDGGVLTHALKAKDCQALLDAALTILRLGQGDPQAPEPDDVQTEAEESNAQSDGQPRDADETASQETQVDRSAVAEETGASSQELAEVKTATPEPKRRRRRTRRPRRVRKKRRALPGIVTLRAGPGLGVLPSLHGQGVLNAGVQLGRWRVMGGAFAYWGAKSPDEVATEWRSNFLAWGGRVSTCALLGRGRWHWPLCAGGTMGQLVGWRSSDAPGPTRVRSIWWSVFARAGVEFDLASRIFALASLRAELLPRRPSVEIENGPRLCCDLALGAATLGMGVRLGRVR